VDFLNRINLLPGHTDVLGLVETEIRELLSKYAFNDDKISTIRGSSLAALEGKPEGIEAIGNLLDAFDRDIVEPQRDIDKPLFDRAANLDGR
jgi:elongation factor Tu